MIYSAHHVVALLLAIGGMAGMLGARWPRRVPRLAILTWQTLGLAVAVSALGLLVSIGVEPTGLGGAPGVADLASGKATAGLTVLNVAALALAGAIAVAALIGVTGVAAQTARRRARLRSVIRLVGEPLQRSGGALVSVIDHPGVVAYCVPGRASDIVLSAGALARLDRRELQAVLAHEEAHVRFRHDLVLLPAVALARFVPLGVGHRIREHLELLVEMCADDYAASRHGRPRVLAALQGLSGSTAGPAGSLAAAGPTTAARCDRLREPGPGAAVVIGGMLAVAAALVIAATPLSLFVLPG